MTKQKLFLDYDGTIINSTKAFCSVYNDIYRNHPDFKEANWWENEIWNLSDVCPLLDNCSDIFSSSYFFDYADFMNGNTKDIIEQLCEKYEVITCSIGTVDNINLKLKWLRYNLPYIKKHHMLVNEDCIMDKSTVNMDGAIFLDDVKSNLDSVNAKVKICVGDTYQWNKDWNGYRCINWTDIGRLLL